MKTNNNLLLTLTVLLAVAVSCSPTGSGNDGTPGDISGTQPADTPVFPIVEPTQEPPPGQNVLFEDDFSDPNSGWDVYSDADGEMAYSNGQYLISVNGDSLYSWVTPNLNFTDVIVELDAQMTSSDNDIQYGIICRYLDEQNWYVLVISADGQAAVRKLYQGGDLEYIADWVNAPSVKTGNQVNRLRAECVGNRLSLYVNGQLAIETFDSDIPTGDIGLMAGTFTAFNVEILFDNLIVYKP
jgi:hypothetical protein